MEPGDVLAIGVILLALAVFLLAGCAGTVRPAPVIRGQASWDGTNQNSGLIGWTNGGGIITAAGRARYNELVAVYGARFSPPLGVDAGVRLLPSGQICIDAQHLAYFATMTRWRREGKL